MGAVVEREVDLLERDALELGRAREREGAERRRPLLAATALDDDVLDVVGAEGAEPLCVGEGHEDLLAAEALGEGEDAPQVAIEGELARDEALQVGVGDGSQSDELVHERAAIAATLGVEEGFDVGGIDDIVAFALVARVARDLVGALVDGDLGGGGLEREGESGDGRGHAVRVAVEVDAAERARAHGSDDARVVRGARERGEERALLGEQVDGPTTGRSVLTHVGDLFQPDAHGAVAGVEVGERSAEDEALLEVLGRVLDAALLIGSVRCARDGFEPVVGGEVEKPRVEADVGADVREHHAAEVVVEDAAHDAARGRESALVAREEDLELLAQRQLDVEDAAVAEHVEEGGEASRLAFDEDRPAGCPVDLGGVAGREREPKERLGRARRPDGSHEVGEYGLAAAVPERARLGAKSHGRQIGGAREHRAQRLLVGIEHGGARLPLGRLEAFELQRLSDRSWRDRELTRDLSLGEMFAQVEAADLGPERGVDHDFTRGRSCASSRRTSPMLDRPPDRSETTRAWAGSSST